MKVKTQHPLYGSMALLALSSGFPAHAAENSGQSPNIILIVADDMGYGDFGCYGNSFHSTPNIDALAGKGIRFTDFHSNGAVSSPTRAALMTGRYQQYAGLEGVITANGHRDVGLPAGTPTLASLLKGQGYRTAIFGKWHLGYARKYNPVHFGFDEFVGYVSGNVDYFSHIDAAGYRDWWHNDSLVEEEGYTTELITDHAVRFIRKNCRERFFLYVPYEACHNPSQGPHDQALRKVTVNGKLEKTGVSPRKDTEACYREMAESLDANIGRILETVREKDIEKNTLILFFSDNGGLRASSNFPWKGKKGNLYEGGHRVSSIACWPGRIVPGQVSAETLLTMDILPTVCSIAGIDPERIHTDGTDFSSLLFQGKELKDRIVFWRFQQQVCAREGEWKLLIDRKNGIETLVNLEKDPQEQTNLYENYPKIAAELKKAIADWEKNFKDIEQKS